MDLRPPGMEGGRRQPSRGSARQPEAEFVPDRLALLVSSGKPATREREAGLWEVGAGKALQARAQLRGARPWGAE